MPRAAILPSCAPGRGPVLASGRCRSGLSGCFLPLFALAAILLGCTPQIGDDCTLSTDCSQLGDRLCDTSQPDGYCTVFNCEPDSCPNAICVAFQPTLDPTCGLANAGQWPRLQRTFCLAQCGSPGTPGDCRSDGYECVDLSKEANQIARAAQVIDTGANDGGLGYMVCMGRRAATDPDSRDLRRLRRPAATPARTRSTASRAATA